MHTAAGCSCGLADARAEADDAIQPLHELLEAARALTKNWVRGDIAAPANTLAELSASDPPAES